MAHASEQSNYLLKEQIENPRLCFPIKEMPQIPQTLERQRHWGETYPRMKEMEFSYLKYIIGNNSQATFHDLCMYQKVWQNKTSFGLVLWPI